MSIIAEQKFLVLSTWSKRWHGGVGTYWLVNWVIESEKHKMNNSFSEETGVRGQLLEMPQYAWWRTTSVLALNPWFIPGEEAPWARLVCTPYCKHLLWRHPCIRVGQLGFRKVEATGGLSPSAAFSRWGNWLGQRLSVASASSSLCSAAVLVPWIWRFSPCCFPCQSWPKGCICYGGRRH